MTDRPRDSGLEIKADDDWKERVRQEARELDAAGVEVLASPTDDAFEDVQLPPADFVSLVQMFSMQAVMAMGLMPEPHSGEVTTSPELARHFIDLLAMLEDKTKGRLNSEEEELLTTSLHELRMAFVELTRNQGA